MQTQILEGKTLGFIGAGNMAEAIIRGMIENKTVDRDEITICDPSATRCNYMQSTYAIHIEDYHHVLAASCDILILAVKPQVAAKALDQTAAGITAKNLLISIVAGLSCAAIQKHLAPGARIVRTVPNTPVFVGDGMVAIATSELLTEEDRAMAEAIFSPVARTLPVEEKLMDAVTGLAGSGPAYVFLLIEALTDGGVKMGLTRPDAYLMAAQTLLGAARMCLETGQNPGCLKEMVTSPAGTTIAALHALENRRVRGALMEAVEVATLRSKQLGKLT